MLTSSSGLRVARCALALLAVSLFCMRVEAGLISYGDFEGESVSFLDVKESTERYTVDGSSVTHSTSPSYGAPTVSTNQDSLWFDPFDFRAWAAGGSFSEVDGWLSTTVVAKPGHWISDLVIREAGDFTLFGTTTTDGTYAQVRAPVWLRVHVDVDGKEELHSVSGNYLDVSYEATPGTWVPVSGGEFNLAEIDAGSGYLWKGEFDFDVEGFLADKGISGYATEVQVNLNNLLFATSESGTLARIAKKDFGITATAVPEPGVPMLLGISLMALLGVRRRRRRA